MSRTFPVGLLNSVTGTYDKTKTTIAGRVFQKTINTQSVLGPPLTNFIDVQTTVGTAPSLQVYSPTSGRLFIVSTASASPTVMLYNFSSTTAAYSYVGKIVITLANAAATTHTFRGLDVDDSGATWKLFLSTTGSVAINGGTYMVNGITAADFTPGGTTIWAAQSTNAKAVYLLQDPSGAGAANTATTSGGCTVGPSSKVYQQNGTAASPVIFAWDYSASPTVANTTASISAQTTLYAGTSPSAFFTSGATNPNLAANDPVILTGTVPANFTASTGTAAQTVYFIRDIQLVLGNYYFNLATTSGGAAVTPSTNTSGGTIMRAFGTSTNLFSLKTGVLSPGLTGTILQSNSFGYCQPTSVPANVTLNGQDCLFLATNSNLYMVKISDLTNGGTTWPSNTGVNLLGTGVDIVAPSATNANYSTVLDKWIYLTNTAILVMKMHQNNSINQVFGGISTQYLELANPTTIPASLATITGLDVHAGFLFITGGTVGQRGVVYCDVRSDQFFGYSYIISPIVEVAENSVFKYIEALEQLFDYTDSIVIQFRTANTSGDATFSTATSGTWTTVGIASDLSVYTLQSFVQFKILFDITTLGTSTPAQIQDIVYSVNYPAEMSNYFAMDVDSTTIGTNSPSYIGFVMTRTYSTLPSAFYVRGYDTAGVLNSSINDNSTATPSKFEVSTNGGVSWVPFTSPSQMSAVGYKIRYNVTTPPGTLNLCTITES